MDNTDVIYPIVFFSIVDNTPEKSYTVAHFTEVETKDGLRTIRTEYKFPIDFNKNEEINRARLVFELAVQTIFNSPGKTFHICKDNVQN